MKRTYYGRSTAFLAASILLLGCWVFFGVVPCIAIFVFVTELVLGKGKAPLDINLIAPPLLLIGVFSGAGYALLASRLKCEQCSRRVFFQEIEAMPHMVQYAGFSGFGAVAMSGLFDKKFQCMHCGKKYQLYKRDRVNGS
jgi:DNA-directed RNA polymerase subunit RPC12/RpoP